MTEPRQEVLFALPAPGTELFVPASSKLEAVTRLAALTSAPPQTLGPGSKERKSVLTNLADGLQIEVDHRWQKPKLGEAIARALGQPWASDSSSAGQTITLVGLNTLLRAGEAEVRRRQEVARLPDFVPARSKLEVVTRIAALTDAPPESLGPGSKERKSAITNLARGIGLTIDVGLTKTEFARALANALGQPWDSSCWSAGETLTLEGLNRILRGAESRVGQRPGSRFDTVAQEAQAVVDVLAEAIPGRMDGRTCVEEMRAAAYSQWAQDEWIGFYFEFKGVPALVNAFGGAPVSYANTKFDYALGSVWDLKAHSGMSSNAPLNSVDAVDTCLASGRGIGFLVLSGRATMDDGSFRQWQREQRLAEGKRRRERSVPSRYRRRSKPAFMPERIESFHFPARKDIEKALEVKAISVMAQGRQVSGAPRRPKYQLGLRSARRSAFHIAERWL